MPPPTGKTYTAFDRTQRRIPTPSHRKCFLGIHRLALETGQAPSRKSFFAAIHIPTVYGSGLSSRLSSASPKVTSVGSLHFQSVITTARSLKKLQARTTTMIGT